MNSVTLRRRHSRLSPTRSSSVSSLCLLIVYLQTLTSSSCWHPVAQEIVRESQRRRYGRVEDVDDVIAMDAKWRDARYELDSLNQEFNKAGPGAPRHPRHPPRSDPEVCIEWSDQWRRRERNGSYCGCCTS